MREFRIIVSACVCITLTLLVLNATCEDLGSVPDEPVDPEGIRVDEEKKAVSTGGNRRPAVQQNANATRDSQLLSVLAARRRQLLNGRLAAHINTLTALANKSNRNNTTYAQLELRDSNSSVIKKITLGDPNEDTTPTLKLITTDGSKEISQDVKPHEIKHLFVPKTYQDTPIRSRAGFLNNRRKELNSTKVNSTSEENDYFTPIYVPPDDGKEGPGKEAILDPEEEFQVDESNHGLYLLNYSDINNVTNVKATNKTASDINTKEIENPIVKSENNTVNTTQNENNVTTDSRHDILNNTEKTILTLVSNNTDTKIKHVKNSNDKDKINNTLFMSDEIYNHFRPLESELAVEDMAPFIFFGQKLGGSAINDNLTNSPSLSASTKSVNFIVAPPDKRKFNSRYSATVKNKNVSAEEEELNEDMDVAVVKNIIEKNKVRNTVKGLAPSRHVGLVNAYRKQAGISPAKATAVTSSNITEAIDSNTTALPTDKGREFTKSYINPRRRPARVSPITENTQVPVMNATTEKSSTLVYTAVVTSVSITSSMKGQNKTDSMGKELENLNVVENNSTSNITNTPKLATTNETVTTTSEAPSVRPYKHRIRIRTTTTPRSEIAESSKTPILKPPTPPSEATQSKISERLANLFKQTEIPEVNSTTSTNISTIRPQNILKRRRRPTTTTSTTPIPTTRSSIKSTNIPALRSVSTTALPSKPIASSPPTTTEENTFRPFVVTSRTSSESSSISKIAPPNLSTITNDINDSHNNNDSTDSTGFRNEEVVIEVEKTYTASYILAGLGFLPVAAIIIFVLRNVLNKKTKELDTEYEGYFDDGDIKKESPITPVARPPMPPPTKPDQKWEFPRNKLRLQTLLGQGNFGQVWKAEADDLTGHDGLTRLVAVKSIKETASQKEKQELLHEIYIMQKIGTHPNVVTLLACCTEQEPYLLIMEYVMCGKLLTYLRERRSRPDRFSGSGALTSRDLTVFAYCVARGMDYIASKGIVHRDLAARNVLVDHNKLCKIADYGMSREMNGEERSRPPQRHALPVRWMAPEALLYNAYNHETDVWAYGILLWEIVTLGSTPYAAMTGREVLSAVTEGYRLERPPHCKPQLYRAMHSCWHADPSQRPTFAALKSQLAELLDNEPVEGNYVDLDSFYQESSVYSDPSAIIHDEEGLSAEYDRERRCFRELAPGKYDNRAFSLRDEELRNKFGIGTPRMGGFGIRDLSFNERNFNTENKFNERAFGTDNDFGERNFSPDKNFNERSFADKNFNERNFSTEQNFQERNFNLDPNFIERKGEKLSTSSFHRERERENPLVSRNSFSGFPRIGSRDTHFQIMSDGRNKRVSEFECDI